MNFYILLVGLAALLPYSSALPAGEIKATQIQSLKDLKWIERFMLFLTHKTKPQRYGNIPPKAYSELFNDYFYGAPSIDNFFIDARQLFTQSKNLEKGASMPEFDWRYRYSFCIWWFCIDEEIAYTTKDSRITGSDTVKSTTNITPTSIENTFEIGLFNWTSPGFEIKITDYINEVIWKDQNAFVAFENVTIALYADYSFVPEVGIQLANTSIYFNSGTVRGWVRDITKWDFNGNLLDTFEPEEYPYDEIMIDYWGYDKRPYTKSLEYSLNCLLSQERNDPEGCSASGNGIPEYFQYANLQLINTLGLGALLQ